MRRSVAYMFAGNINDKLQMLMYLDLIFHVLRLLYASPFVYHQIPADNRVQKITSESFIPLPIYIN